MRKSLFGRSISMIMASILLMGSFSLPVNVGASEAESSPMAELYVAPDGDDSAAGTSSAPLKTIEGARNKVRKINGNMTGDIIVYIKGGTYTIDKTIEFTSVDSATNGFRIIYRAAEGESPAVSGGEAITGWELHDAEKNIYKASVSDGHIFRQLYVDGEKAIRAQNTAPGEFYNIADVSPMEIDAESYKSGYLWIKKSDIPTGMSLDSLKGAEIHEIIAWTDNVLRIQKATEDGDNIKLKLMRPEESAIFNRPHPWVGFYTQHSDGYNPYYLANAYELIDIDGEWYLDSESDTLFYKAAKGVDMNKKNVIAPKVEILMNVEGTLDKKIEGLTIEGLTFEHSNWTYPSENGFVNSQSGLPVIDAELTNKVTVSRPSAAVHIGCTENFRFEKNTLTNIGNIIALDLEYATTRSVIKNNLITKVAGNGIMVARGSDEETYEYHNVYNPVDPRTICDGDNIVNNKINNTGLDYEGTCAIFAIYPKNITIANNEIDKVSYTGISLGYGWSDQDSPMSGNVVLRNKISNHMCVANDGGAIYTLSKQPDSILAENYIFDVGSTAVERGLWAVYNDEKTSGYTVAWNVSEGGGGYANNGAGDLNRHDNYFGNAPADVKDEVLKNAGNQDYFNYTDEPLSAIYDLNVNGRFVELEGYFNRNTIKSIVFTDGNNSEIEVPLEDAESISASRIVCAIPSNAVAGPIFVRTSDNMDSNSKALYNQAVSVERINDGFESYEKGAVKGNDVWKGNNYAEIADNDTSSELHGSKLLKLNGPSSGNGKVESINKYIVDELQFDFYFLNEEKAYYGFYIRVGDDRIMICPGYSTVLRVDTVAGMGNSGKDPVIATETWYTCRFIYDVDGNTKVKVWEKAAGEPEEWNIESEGVRSDGEKNCTVKLEYHSPNRCSAYIDNVVIKENNQYLLELPPIESLAAAEASTRVGKAPSMPQKVTATCSNGDVVKVPVVWDEIDPNSYAVGDTSFVVKGSVTGTNILAECMVSVIYQPDDVIASLESGIYKSEQELELSCITENAKIYYTTDGTDPTTDSNLYSGKITLTENTTLKAVSYVDGWVIGEIVTFEYIVAIIAVETSVVLDKETLTLTVGASETLTATVVSDGDTSQSVKWTSSNEEIATVSAEGVVTGVKAGNVTITATAGDRSATCEVTVVAENESTDADITTGITTTEETSEGTIEGIDTAVTTAVGAEGCKATVGAMYAIALIAISGAVVALKKKEGKTNEKNIRN